MTHEQAALDRAAIRAYDKKVRERAVARLDRAMRAYPFSSNPMIHASEEPRWNARMAAIVNRATRVVEYSNEIMLDDMPIPELARAAYEECLKDPGERGLVARKDAQGRARYFENLPTPLVSSRQVGKTLVRWLSGDDREPEPYWWSRAGRERDEAAAKAKAEEKERERLAHPKTVEDKLDALIDLQRRQTPEGKLAAAQAEQARKASILKQVGAVRDDSLGRQMVPGIRAHVEKQLAAAKAQAAADPGDEAAQAEIEHRQAQLAQLGAPAE